MSLDDKYITDDFNVNVYRLNSVQEYLNFLEIHDREIDDDIGESTDYLFDMSKYPINFSFSSTLVENSTASWLYDLRFPDKLLPGWYIVDVKSNESGLHFQNAIKVSDISVYTYGLNGEVNVWCNDASSGNIITGATVQIGDFASLSNKDGIATFNFNDSPKNIPLSFTLTSISLSPNKTEIFSGKSTPDLRGIIAPQKFIVSVGKYFPLSVYIYI